VATIFKFNINALDVLLYGEGFLSNNLLFAGIVIHTNGERC